MSARLLSRCAPALAALLLAGCYPGMGIGGGPHHVASIYRPGLASRGSTGRTVREGSRALAPPSSSPVGTGGVAPTAPPPVGVAGAAPLVPQSVPEWAVMGALQGVIMVTVMSDGRASPEAVLIGAVGGAIGGALSGAIVTATATAAESSKEVPTGFLSRRDKAAGAKASGRR